MDDLIQRALAGERRAIGRLLTVAERGGEPATALTTALAGRQHGAHVIGVTGAPGAGKSTLVAGLVGAMVDRGDRPAVLAVDPSSPLTGGAILGDRVRMDDVAGDGSFIRSVATRGHAGGLALSVPGSVRAFDACGFDPVLIETVGVGQVEVDVAGAADTTVVVVNPGWGDAVQANKAGLLEVADVFVINKADRDGASDTRRDLELMLDLSHVSGHEDDTGYRPPILLTTATDGSGVEQMWEAVAAHRAHLESTGGLARRRAERFRYEVESRVRTRLDEWITEAADSVEPDGRAPSTVAAEIASRLGERRSG